MSATSNNPGVGWNGPPAQAAELVPEALPKRTPLSGREPLTEGGQNALQALLAFACIHEQAARRRQLAAAQGATEPSSKPLPEEQFALDEVLQLVAVRALSITGADGVAIALAQENAIVCRAASGRIAPDAGARLDPNSGFSGACLVRGQTVRCDDSETDPRVNAEACRALGARSMVAVPLIAKRRVIGLIEAFSSDAYGFNDSDVRGLNLLGELILAAIRPEEEDRLAELASQVVPEVSSGLPAPAGEGPTKSSARILVDEKFAPAKIPPLVVRERSTPSEPVSEPGIQLPPEPVAPQARETQPAAASDAKAQKDIRSIGGLALTATAVLVAVVLLWALIWKGRHMEQHISADTQRSMEVKAPDATATAEEVLAPESPPAKPGPIPQVTGVRHMAAADSSTVIVDLEDQVQYEAHTLDNPPRIYFDLHDTKIASGLVNQSVEVNDPFIKRIRMAQPVEGITRVVLETKKAAEFSVSLEPNPYRLTIQVREPSPVHAVPAPVAKPSPAVPALPNKGPSSQSAATSGSFQIVLDAGHGGWDLGTVGRKGLLEKDLVLDVVQRLGKLLETNLGAQVVYTRTDDSYLPLEKRAEIANLSRADVFLSVHANYSDLTTARGVETYYTNTYSSVKARLDSADPALKEVDWTGVDIRAKVKDSHQLAADIQQALYGALAARNPDIRNRGVKEAQYVVLTGTQMPAVLAEVSFVSSPADEDKLQNSEYRQHIAEALFKGVAKFRDDMKRTKLASASKSGAN